MVKIMRAARKLGRKIGWAELGWGILGLSLILFFTCINPYGGYNLLTFIDVILFWSGICIVGHRDRMKEMEIQ
jgi:hypothetical protein